MGRCAPFLPSGAKIAVLHGDPAAPGPYAVRLRFPANYKAAALTATRSVSTRLLTAADDAEQHCHVGNAQLSLTLATNWLAEIQLAAQVRAASR